MAALGRETGYVAVHRYWREDPRAHFAEVERIMLDHDGRPHWGKLHTQNAADLEPRLPTLADFRAPGSVCAGAVGSVVVDPS